MQDFTLYTWNEVVALFISVVMGTGAYLGVVANKNNKKVTIKFIFWVFFINLFVTHVFAEILRKYDWGTYRSLILPLVAFAGQYIVDWLDKRYLKIFDAAAKKGGLDIGTTEETIENSDLQLEKKEE